MQTSPCIIRRPRDFGSHSINSPTTITRRNRTQSKPFSKTAAISVILLHVFLTGMIAGSMDYSATAAIVSNISKAGNESILLKYMAHCITLLALFIYPFFGFLADVYFGRYWMVVVSVFVMALGTLVSSVTIPLYQAFWEADHHRHLIRVLFVISYCLAGLGIAGFEANMIQFGLDQLMDSSSRSLSLYLHLLVWVRQAGVALIIIPLTLVDCDYMKPTHSQKEFKGVFQFLPLIILVALVAVPLVTLVRLRKGFYRELGDMNPYKMVFKVLCYVLKNPRPQRRRSAFYYYYGLKPGRMDFAKVHYGGPFETEDVENVKTVLQILAVIICVGPVFILRVSTSYFIYQHFVEHFVAKEFIQEHCAVFWPLVGSGNQMNLMGTVLFPVYIFVVFKLLKNIPKILLRLLIGLVMVTLCLGCFLLIELAGHWTQDGHGNGTTVQCALMPLNNSSANSSLDIHWASLIPPNLLTGLATEIIFTAVFEFISAQSPKSMTGLLIGTFFFVMGFFQLLGLALVAPFTERKFWDAKGVQNFTRVTDNSMDYLLFEMEEKEMLETQAPHWVSTACEMWYLSAIVILGILGIILFSVASCKYQYRKREENPFPQSDIEDIVTRGIEQESTQNLLDVASVEAQRDAYGSGSGRGLCPAGKTTTTTAVIHDT